LIVCILLRNFQKIRPRLFFTMGHEQWEERGRYGAKKTVRLEMLAGGKILATLTILWAEDERKSWSGGGGGVRLLSWKVDEGKADGLE
jgi:hypothetical protein